ncbi:integrase [Desulforhopalus sp. 52FAK]
MIRVGAKKKTWIVRYMMNGKQKAYSLPIPYPECTLEEATKEYRKIRGNIDRGEDPQADKQIKKKEPTIAVIMELYLKETPLLSKGLRESQRISEKDIIPHLGTIKASDLRRQHIKGLHSIITKRGAPVMANRALELLRRAFNHACEEELIETNTFPSIKKIKHTEYSRKRVLTDEEIKKIWTATDILSSNMRDIYKLLLLLGQRTQDICAMQTSDIDDRHKQWTVPAPPRAKNQSPNILPLPPYAWQIIEPRLSNEKWLFPSKHNTNRLGYQGEGRTTSIRKARLKLISQTGVSEWTGHDLRRTMRTLLARQKIPLHIAERIIGHVQSGVEEIYDRFVYLDEKKEALGKLENLILTITEQI